MSAYESVLDIVKEWHPKMSVTELQYRDSLIALLRERISNAQIEKEFRHGGTTIDIYVKKPGFFSSTEVFIELKRNFLQKPQLDRLVGQLESLEPGKHPVIVILCGQTDPALFTRLKAHFKSRTEDSLFSEPMSIVLKEAAQRRSAARSG